MDSLPIEVLLFCFSRSQTLFFGSQYTHLGAAIHRITGNILHLQILRSRFVTWCHSDLRVSSLGMPLVTGAVARSVQPAMSAHAPCRELA